MKRFCLLLSLMVAFSIGTFAQNWGGQAGSQPSIPPPWGLIFGGQADSTACKIYKSANSTLTVAGTCRLYGVTNLDATKISSLLFHAAITTANILASTDAASTRYRVGYHLFQAAAGSGGTCDSNATATVTLGWTDPSDTAQTKAEAAVNLAPALAAGAMGMDEILIVAKASSAITYAVAWADGNCTTQPTASIYAQAQVLP